VSVEIRFCGHLAIVDGSPSDGEWGVSMDVPEGEGFAGHSDTYSSAEEALRSAWSLLNQ